MDDITDSADMNLSNLQQIVKDREAWHAAVQGHKESDTAEQLSHRDRRQSTGAASTHKGTQSFL